MIAQVTTGNQRATSRIVHAARPHVGARGARFTTADRRADRSRAAGRRDTGAMTTATTRIERSGPAVRAALAQLSPGECAQFEAEFAQATARAGAEYDLAPAQQVLDRWWGIAVIRANPLSDHEQAQLARAREGVFDGLWERDDHGDWHQL